MSNELLEFHELISLCAKPGAEPRIGHEDRVKDIFKELMRDNRDRRPGDPFQMSPFLRREEI